MRLITLLWLCLCLAGCAAIDSVSETVSGISDYFSGGEDNTDPPAPLAEYAPEIKIEELWKESIGVGADEQALKLVAAESSGKVFAADRDGLVQARNSGTGKLIWETETETALSAGPGLGAGTVIVGSSNAEVIALNSESGAQLWRTSVSSEVLSVPTVAHQIVVVRTADGGVQALNEKTGAKLWHYEVAVPTLSVRGTARPLVVEDHVISGYDNGKLMALRLDNGKYVWESSVAIPKGRSEVERLVDVDADPISVGGVIYASSFHGGVAAVSELDGDVLWHNDTISSYTGLSNDWRNLYLSDADSDVWQLDQRSGSSLWKQKDLHQRRLSAPAVYESYVVVGDFEGYAHWLSTSDGRQLARVQISDSAIEAKPIVVGNIVYIYATDGTLAALTAH